MTKKIAGLTLQERIKNLIIKRNLKSGDLMPTENELIEALDVSRSSLREAIKSLEALHILDIKHGVGTFVSESSLVPMIRGLSFHTQINLQNSTKYLMDILDIREILEYGFAPMVLARMTSDNLAQLHRLVERMEKKARQKQYAPEEEHEIHLVLYLSLQNDLLIQYLDAFWQIYQQVESDLPAIPLPPEGVAIQHRELIDAVESRDLNRMQQAILHYFQHIRQRLTREE